MDYLGASIKNKIDQSTVKNLRQSKISNFTKRGKYKIFGLKDKMKVVSMAHRDGIKVASNKFQISEKNIKRWIQRGI